MTITTNIDKRTRTTRQMTELQRDSFETLAKNFAALQRRNVELTQMWMTGVYRTFFPFTYAIYAQDGLKAAQQGTEQALEATQQALEATQQVAQQGLRVAEEATVKAEQATAKAEQATAKAEQATMEAKQATAKTQAETREAALRLEEETREVALQAAVHRSLETKNYEELNVDEVSNKLDGLSATELKKVREYEEHNKNRETLIAEIDRRLSATA
jgi:multidrug efflux pump subunit AcrA (membrane-fusion protein)